MASTISLARSRSNALAPAGPSQMFAGMVACVGIVVVGYFDYLTGSALSLVSLYFIPITVAAWHFGFSFVAFISVLALLTSFMVSSMAGLPPSAGAVVGWNGIIHLVAFLVVGWTVARLRLAYRQKHAALAEIKVLQSILPICAACKQIKCNDGEWQQFEAYIQRHTNAKFSHGLCPECCADAMQELLLLEEDPQ